MNPNAARDRARIGELITSMKAMFEPKTSEPWDRGRKNRLESMATSIKLSGGEVAPRTSNGN